MFDPHLCLQNLQEEEVSQNYLVFQKAVSYFPPVLCHTPVYLLSNVDWDVIEDHNFLLFQVALFVFVSVLQIHSN